MNKDKLLIMLIDDDEIHNFICEETIKKFDKEIEIVAYNQPRKALSYLKSNYKFPDIILLDINMPLVNGWDFVNEFSRIKEEKNKFCFLNLLTSSDSMDDIKKAESFTEILAYISKPLTIEDFEELYSFYLKTSASQTNIS
jgi:response regulator RpfG family c-di-GMP phosphodiesterase